MAVNSNVSYDQTSFIPTKCFKCKGSCYVPGNPSETQRNAHKLFGDLIPDKCVPFESNMPACPAALGLFK